MDLRLLERIVLDQQEELRAWEGRKICPRPEEDLIDLTSELAQVVIGVRRSGKSTLCLNKLKRNQEPFGYLNFDDERLVHITSQDLDMVLSAVYRYYGDVPILFFDEIQNVDAWPLFVNRLLRLGKRILLTGSNAKLLSSELATHMTGRSRQIILLPFSFEDACVWRGVPSAVPTARNQGLLREAFDRYSSEGGFPQVVKETEDPRVLVGELVENILERDIRQRYALRNAEPFRALAHHLLNVAPVVLNYKTLCNRFERMLAPNTAKRYVAYLKQAYLLVGVQRYSTKSHLRVRNEKVYPIDVSFMNQRANAFANENHGWRLESIVFLELLRRASQTKDDVYYYQEARTEIDFVVCRGSRILSAVQVAHDISSSRVRARELRALESLSKTRKSVELFLLTDHAYEDVELSTGAVVHIRPACEWLRHPPR